jgi:cytochrome c
MEGGITMKRTIIACIIIVFVVVGFVYAQDCGTAEEAKAMLDKAIAFYKANGPEKAFATFNDPKGAFVYKDLYVFVVDLNGKVLAHGANAGLIGKGMNEISDADGKNFIAEMVVVAQSKGAGTVDYWWENPLQYQVVEAKSSYIERVDGAVLGCGYYKGFRWRPSTL